MTGNEELRNDAATGQAEGAQAEALQAVVDRVLSWQEGAPTETVEGELRRALDEAGLEVDDTWIRERAQQISDADPASQ